MSSYIQHWSIHISCVSARNWRLEDDDCGRRETHWNVWAVQPTGASILIDITRFERMSRLDFVHIAGTTILAQWPGVSFCSSSALQSAANIFVSSVSTSTTALWHTENDVSWLKEIIVRSFHATERYTPKQSTAGHSVVANISLVLKHPHWGCTA